MLTQFDELTQKVIVVAESLAFDMGHSQVGSEHILLSLLKIKETPFSKVLSEYKVDALKIYEDILRLFGKTDHQPFYMEYSDSTRKILDDAISHSISLKEDKVSVNQLSLALLMQKECVAIELLNQYHVPINKVKKALIKDKSYIHELDSIFELTNINKKMKSERRIMIGRDRELKQLCMTLCKKEKNNALIIGKAGVGKSALVERLADMINNNEVHDLLKDKVIYELNLSGIVAGTKYRGEFEEKLRKIIDKVIKAKDVIVFIDEMHNLIGAGGAEGAIDASNILKPYLARKDLTIIGATTLEEYYKFFEKDHAMNRRFSLIKINENTKEETYNILLGLKELYENYHCIKIDEYLLYTMIDLCDRYILDRVFPDKAIDVLDLSCVKAVFMNDSILSVKHIECVIEEICGIRMHQQYNYDDIACRLKEEIKGQDKGINRLIQSIYSLSQYPDEQGVKGVYMLLGSQGIGKTYCIECLAQYMGKHFISLNMNEYSEDYSVYKIIGDVKGYHDHSLFIKDVILYPDSIILLNNIDKASHSVLNMFMQIFDDGIIKDGCDRIISFKNTMFVMSSNIIQGNQAGFHKHNNYQLKEYFDDEFISRMNDIIYFDTLTNQSIKEIFKKYPFIDLMEDEVDSFLDVCQHRDVKGMISEIKKYMIQRNCIE